jgi:phage antirepressor YoqD-like protein
MNDLARVGEVMAKAMTVVQVADALGVNPEAIKKHVRELYPNLMQNGKVTFLDERQVTEIKRRMIPTTKVTGAVTSLEMAEKAREVMAWLMSETDRMRAELAIAAPKVESFDVLMRSKETMSITDASKLFGLHPKTQVFPYLRDRGYLTLSDLPTQAAIDAGYLSLREAKATNGKIYPQAVVKDCQLETWRVRVVPQIKAYRA